MPDECLPPKPKFYITTPIYYVNARPHIGHAYSTIVGDVLARRHRLLGDDTWFLTGTDEHGQKIERSAAAAGIAPQTFADEVSETFRTLWRRMGITNDGFIRTTEERHKRGAQKLFAELYAKGQIYLSTYTGQYSIGEEMFVEGPPGTMGPDGRPTETVTEENFFFRLSNFQKPLLELIESDGLKITPESSKNEVLSFLTGNVGATFDLSFEGATSSDDMDAVMKVATDEFVRTGVLGRTAGGRLYVPGALKDLSVSRSSFTWGIPVPEPAASEAAQQHVIYVWLDALANYMTALGYGGETAADAEMFARFWPTDVHLVGKEITRFHCVYWPAFLLAAGLPTPKAVTANGWLLFDNAKMSKSKGNVVRAETILEGFGELVYGKQFPDSTKAERDLFGADVLRYYLLREIPFGQDGSFSFESMVTRYNADLANGYGNLVSRVLAMIQKYLGSTRPSGTMDLNLGVALNLNVSAVWNNYLELDFAALLHNIMNIVSLADGYITATAPWKLSVDESRREELIDVLYTAVESIRIVTSLIFPVLPYTAEKVFEQLGIPVPKPGLEPKWAGSMLGPLGPIFPRAEKALAGVMEEMESGHTVPLKEQGQTQIPFGNNNQKGTGNGHGQVSVGIDRQEGERGGTMTEPTVDTSQEPASPVTHPADPLKDQGDAMPGNEPVRESTHPGAAPRTSSLEVADAGSSVAASHAVTTERDGTPPHQEAQASGVFAGQGAADTAQIGIDDFMKVDLRVAQIVAAERIPKADKLLRLEVDLGYERRQLLSGIGDWYTPEELVGRRIVIVANLAPRKMRGLESRGMLLAAAEGEDGRPVLATLGEGMALGTRVR